MKQIGSVSAAGSIRLHSCEHNGEEKKNPRKWSSCLFSMIVRPVTLSVWLRQLQKAPACRVKIKALKIRLDIIVNFELERNTRKEKPKQHF